MTFDEKVAELKQLAKEKADRKNTLMYRRIADVEKLYIAEMDEAVQEAKDTAAKFGIATTNDEQMIRVLDLVLGNRGIDVSKPAPLFTESEQADATGQLAQSPNGTVVNNQEAGGGPRSEPGEAAGSVNGQRGGDGIVAQSGSGGPRRKARRAAGTGQ